MRCFGVLCSTGHRRCSGLRRRIKVVPESHLVSVASAETQSPQSQALSPIGTYSEALLNLEHRSFDWPMRWFEKMRKLADEFEESFLEFDAEHLGS